MSLDDLKLSSAARRLLRANRIKSIDQARTWTQWDNLFKNRDNFVEHMTEITEIQLAVAAFDQRKGSSFRDCYVAFIDILGFSALVAKADTDENARETIRAGLRGFSSILGRSPNPDLHFSQFSDNIVLSARRDENGLFYVLEATINIAFALLKVGLLVRGGIVAGKLEHTDAMLFGQALVEAYDLERSGGPPRIIVSRAVIEDRPSQRLLQEMWSSSIFLDEYDLSHAVHTLLYAETYHEDGGSPITAAEAEEIVRVIGEQASDLGSAPNIRAKWRWMARYWNRTVCEKGLLPAIQLAGIG